MGGNGAARGAEQKWQSLTNSHMDAQITRAAFGRCQYHAIESSSPPQGHVDPEFFGELVHVGPHGGQSIAFGMNAFRELHHPKADLVASRDRIELEDAFPNQRAENVETSASIQLELSSNFRNLCRTPPLGEVAQNPDRSDNRLYDHLD